MTDTVRPNPAIRELPIDADGTVEISLTSNDLRLRGTGGDRVVIRTRDGEPVDEQVTIEAGSARVRISDDGPDDLRLGPLRVRTRHTADLDIEMPRGVAVQVRTLSGDVDAVGIAGASRWATASGGVRLKAEGGPITAETMSGDLQLECTTAVGVSARSVSGDIHVRAPELLELVASTTSGDIEVEAALSERAAHSISSVSGDVLLATGSAVRLEAQTITGDIRGGKASRAEGGRGRRTLVVGDGRVMVSVRTTSGDVRLQGGPGRPGTAGSTARPEPPVPPVPPVAPEPPPAPADPSIVVAEASAAPNLVRPADPGFEDRDRPGSSGSETGEAGSTEGREAARLDILRALERGDVDVETASRHLEALEEAGPRPFRRWS